MSNVLRTIDILEDKLKLALSRKSQLEAERQELLGELERLRESVRNLETEKQEVRARLDQIIEKIEIFLGRQGG